MDKNYYTIGEISKICDIPIRTLRYYDDIELVVPKKRENNNYRLYHADQIIQINQILQYKIQGYSIKEIKEHLNNNSIEFSKETLTIKRKEIQETIHQLQTLEKRMAYQLSLLTYKDRLPHINLKTIPERQIVYLREKGLAEPAAFMRKFAQLNTLIQQYNLTPISNVMARYYDDYREYDITNADIEVFLEIEEQQLIKGITRKMESLEVVSALHYGPYQDEYKTYTIMMQWMDEHDYVMCAPAIEHYLIDAILTNDVDEYVTELMIPVIKKT